MGRGLNLRPFGALVDSLRRAIFQVESQTIDQALRLPDDDVIRFEVGPADRLLAMGPPTTVRSPHS